MKLPWISRAHHLHIVRVFEDVLRDCQKERNAANGLVAAERERANKLVDKVLAMRKEGYEPVYPDVEIAPQPLDKYPLIRAAINEVADDDERPYLESYAMNELKCETDPQDILNTIYEGLPLDL